MEDLEEQQRSCDGSTYAARVDHYMVNLKSHHVISSYYKRNRIVLEQS